MTTTELIRDKGRIVFTRQSDIEAFADLCEVMPHSIIPTGPVSDHRNWASFLREGRALTVTGMPSHTGALRGPSTTLKNGTTVPGPIISPFAKGCFHDWYYEAAQPAAEPVAAKEEPVTA